MSRKKVELERQQQIAEEIRRVRLPRDKETLGILDQRLGASRMRVRCMDGKTRICRIPGRLKRKIWVQEGDTLLVEPWELGGDEKGDIIFKYKQTQVSWLQRNGYLKQLEEFQEF
ncbi:translation initiation factor eIF-1A [Candidatus Woesearchaeota archaeon]|nr:translation initiation factor eIF-1A [Candidatus Woesearchaeota archaeon]MDP1694452.1 translation initiation factor eIF-1A [Candidatus Woesearchaeota archaeon]